MNGYIYVIQAYRGEKKKKRENYKVNAEPTIIEALIIIPQFFSSPDSSDFKRTWFSIKAGYR